MHSLYDKIYKVALEEQTDEEARMADTGGDWFEFERHLKEKSPKTVASLNPAASEDEVRDAESDMRLKFPPEYVKLLKIHNGQNDDIGPLFGRYNFASLKEVVSTANQYDGDSDDHTADEEKIEQDKEVKKTWWLSGGWIPFAIADNGDALCIDTQPTSEGKVGQVIEFSVKKLERTLVSTHFSNWLSRFIDSQLDEREEKPAKKEAPEPKKEPEKKEGKATEEMASNRQEGLYDLYMRPLARENPKLFATFNPPATFAEISEANAKFGIQLPEEYTNLLRCANGQKSVPAFFGKYLWLSLKTAANLFSAIKTRGADGAKTEADKEIKPVEQSLKWIPFAEDKDGDTLCLDFDPTPEGTVGQVIAVNYTDATRRLMASSFDDYLEKKFKEPKGARTATEGWFSKDKEDPVGQKPANVKEEWARLVAWHKEQGNDLEAQMRPPASSAAIQKAEQTIGVKFPNEYVELLRLHNGQAKGRSIFNGFDFMAIEEVVQNHQFWETMQDEFVGDKSKPDKGIKDDWRNEKWVGFAENGGGDDICFDFDPAPGGTKGQIIEFAHDWEGRTLIAPTFAEFLRKMVDRITAPKKK